MIADKQKAKHQQRSSHLRPSFRFVGEPWTIQTDGHHWSQATTVWNTFRVEVIDRTQPADVPQNLNSRVRFSKEL
jgi:hypothetical protein